MRRGFGNQFNMKVSHVIFSSGFRFWFSFAVELKADFISNQVKYIDNCKLIQSLDRVSRMEDILEDQRRLSKSFTSLPLRLYPWFASVCWC